MPKATPFAAVLVAVAILSGCAAPAGDPPSNPLQDMIDLIPWAKSVADDASVADVTARIEEIRAALPNLAIPDAARNEVQNELENLSAQITANPDDVRAHVDQLRSIVAQLQAAVAAGP